MKHSLPYFSKLFAIVIDLYSKAQQSVQIKDCRTRYNGDADHHQRRKKFTFPARLLCGDCYEVINFFMKKTLFMLGKFMFCKFTFHLGLYITHRHSQCLVKKLKRYENEKILQK